MEMVRILVVSPGAKVLVAVWAAYDMVTGWSQAAERAAVPPERFPPLPPPPSTGKHLLLITLNYYLKCVKYHEDRAGLAPLLRQGRPCPLPPSSQPVPCETPARHGPTVGRGVPRRSARRLGRLAARGPGRHGSNTSAPSSHRV